MTIDGLGRTVRLDAAGPNGSVVTVGAGVTLTLRNIVFEGKAGNKAALIKVQDGGTLILETGALITGNTNTAIGGGGGVWLAGGHLTMTGDAAISGNEANNGGGVYSADSSGINFNTFKMSGNARIKGNSAPNGGSVYLMGASASEANPAVLYLYGGTIYGMDAGGKDADGIDLKNIDASSGVSSALYKQKGAQYWLGPTKIAGDTESYSENNTIGR